MNLPLTNIGCVGQNELYKNESHGRKSDRELFCVIGNDSDHIDIVFDDIICIKYLIYFYEVNNFIQLNVNFFLKKI